MCFFKAKVMSRQQLTILECLCNILEKNLSDTSETRYIYNVHILLGALSFGLKNPRSNVERAQ